MSTQAPRFQREERSVGELAKDLTQHATDLVRSEIELAKVELAEKGRRAGAGAGMFGAAGTLGFYAVGALTAAAIAGLATTLSTWLAALVVAGAYALAAGVLALTGRRQVAKAGRPVPEQTIQSVKEDVEWTRTSVQQARR